LKISVWVRVCVNSVYYKKWTRTRSNSQSKFLVHIERRLEDKNF